MIKISYIEKKNEFSFQKNIEIRKKFVLRKKKYKCFFKINFNEKNVNLKKSSVKCNQKAPKGMKIRNVRIEKDGFAFLVGIRLYPAKLLSLVEDKQTKTTTTTTTITTITTTTTTTTETTNEITTLTTTGLPNKEELFPMVLCIRLVA